MVANLADIETNSIAQKPILSLIKNESSNSGNNISELLAGNTVKDEKNISDIKDKDLQNDKNINYKDLLSLIIPIALGCFVGGIVAPKFFSHLLNIRSLAKFKPITFEHSFNMEKVKQFAQKLGIKIQGGQSNVEQFNDTLRVLTDIHNQSKGRIKLPKKLVMVKSFKDSRLGDATELRIRLKKDSDFITLFHELGHINHFKKLGHFKYLKLHNKQFKDFGIDKDTLDNISALLGRYGRYATTNPHEFVAVCYEKLLRGVKLPDKIMRIYKMFNGPENWKYYKISQWADNQIRRATAWDNII